MNFTRGGFIGSLKQPKTIPPTSTYRTLPTGLSDRDGLRLAYQQPDHVYIQENKMYIAGSKTATDWVHNVAFIPTQQTQYHNIYKSAFDQLKKNPQVNELIGHSAGGAVLLELQKQYPNRFDKTRSYSAPVFNPLGSGQLNENHLRFRTIGDPVAMLDNGAITMNKNILNPFITHSFTNYGEI